MTKKNRRALNRFFVLLRKTRGWRMSNGWLTSSKRLLISKTSRFVGGSNNPHEYCPLTGACRFATGRVIGVFHHRQAATLLRLNWRTADCLVAAADGETNTRTKRAYRRRLLEVVGLTE